MYSRGLIPANFRLWGKGASARLVRMDQFIFNLGLVLCNSTGATEVQYIYKKIVVEVQKGELLVEVKTNIRDNEKEWRK